MSSPRLACAIAGTAAGAAVVAYAVYMLRKKRDDLNDLSQPEPLAVPQSAIASNLAEVSQSAIASNLAEVRKRLRTAAVGRSEPRLLAVSKTKPVEDLLEAYAVGQRDFAENYVQELIGKVTQMPPDVRWHFIGNLQSNKAKELVRGCGPLLAAIETVDSAKLADKIDAAVASLPEVLRRTRAQPLELMIQVNTSPWEGTKSGVVAADVPALADHIRASCSNVKLAGLMTIGAPGEPGCFTALCGCRDALARHLQVQPSTLRLSMGMSGDFEEAVAAGSDSVRVGSSIFGGRNYTSSKPPQPNSA